MKLTYDLDDPPENPPPGCDRLLWQVAYALRAEHTPGPDGWCIAGTCKDRSALWPCDRRKLADAGLMGSVGAEPGGRDVRRAQVMKNQRR